ncbi:MAG: hypothetical protein CMP53_09220 [Flavobacteriales bacterium]|nr:hypothetical protein [Flavobacteriales bacterium]|tara:strand:- start:95 stop:469 length:375 start_codon:yes stop_codon:yes gene_type:complete
MKLSSKVQKEVNDWWRIHGDTSYKPDWGKIKLSVANTREHNLRVCEICITLLEMGLPFATEARLKTGVRPDIIAPTHVLPIIEVLWSETNEDFLEKKSEKYHPDLFGKWILHSAKHEYNPRLIM